jgi:sulfite dehydrogenase (quinone) subunit SoeA
VLVDLAGRLRFPAFTGSDGAPKFADYKDFIVRYERAPGIGFLAGWRGADGKSPLVGEPNPAQWEAYIGAQAFFSHHWPDRMKYMRFANRDYLQEAARVGFIGKPDPIVLQLYSEPLQKFRLAGQGLYPGPRPPRELDRQRLASYFDPLPVWYPPLQDESTDTAAYPMHAITQRPMFMYHSWDSQNAWLRQIVTQNRLYMNAATAARLGLVDDDWVWVEAMPGGVPRRVRCQLKTMQGCEPNTVWTWNAIGKMSGTWGLDPKAPEATAGFLLNDLIADVIAASDGTAVTNSDPITGQAAWYDLRVRVVKAEGPPDAGANANVKQGDRR